MVTFVVRTTRRVMTVLAARLASVTFALRAIAHARLADGRCSAAVVGFAHPSRQARTPSHKESEVAVSDRKPKKTMQPSAYQLSRPTWIPTRQVLS
jgi:hypothetical protein